MADRQHIRDFSNTAHKHESVHLLVRQEEGNNRMERAGREGRSQETDRAVLAVY